MSKYDYIVTWAEKSEVGYNKYVYWFLPGHDEYCIESVEQIEITKSFADRINKANMGNIISGFRTNGKKITVKIGARRF